MVETAPVVVTADVPVSALVTTRVVDGVEKDVAEVVNGVTVACAAWVLASVTGVASAELVVVESSTTVVDEPSEGIMSSVEAKETILDVDVMAVDPEVAVASILVDSSVVVDCSAFAEVAKSEVVLGIAG